jgi:hypothetical protein
MNIISRLNCSNCKFVSSKKVVDVDSKDLNPQGGIKDSSPAEKTRGKNIRLITLPGKMKVTSKHWCENSTVDQWVTEHMWCRKWEAVGTIHPSDK